MFVDRRLNPSRPIKSAEALLLDAMEANTANFGYFPWISAGRRPRQHAVNPIVFGLPSKLIDI
jgi:hypothetical protein